MTDRYSWDRIKLEDLATITGGGTPSRNNMEYWKGNIPWVTPTDVTKNNKKYLNDASQYITTKGLEKSAAKIIPANSVLMTSRATIGKCVINTLPVTTNQGFANFICSENCIPGFLYYLLTYYGPRFEQLGSGSTFKEISKGELRSFAIQRPSIVEQKEISSILSSVDEAIEKTKQIIEQTTKVKKGLMQQLLTKGIGHTKFKKTPIGEIPEGWSHVTLSKVLRVQGGYAFKSKDASNSGIKWLKIANVGLGEILWNDQSYLPGKFEENHPDYLLEENDIVMAMTRPVIREEAKVARLSNQDVPSLLNQRVGRFHVKDGLNKEFLYQLAKSNYFATEILLKIAGTDPPNISAKQIESIEVPLPSEEEQKKISDILSVFDVKALNGRKELEQLERLKKGLMQQLLTGKTRVPIDDEDEVMPT
ncbi:restriction endonuclease subunit S [Halobacillus ihumii]|uniref:restriction endonuclease subunit S n=1 Tax=Halobacillus ihumii TaxID=2686092 RepID=UPI0013D59ADD|nr:restriction endonuclease subunit S [Halobacillus ihumii]